MQRYVELAVGIGDAPGNSIWATRSHTSLIAAAAILCVLSLTAVVAQAFSGAGSGTIADPYQITNVGQLQEMANDLGAYYALMNDIDLTGSGNWAPVGNEPNPFRGGLKGNGRTLSNLTVSGPAWGIRDTGLFGATAPSAMITWVRLTNVSVSGTDIVGALVGFNQGSICSCYASGTLRGSGTFGGLVGANSYGGRIHASAANVNVSGGNHLGGLCGTNTGRIEDSYARGTVSGLENPGGLVGVNYSLILNCYATGNVSGNYGSPDRGAGGLVGENQASPSPPDSVGTITNCFATGGVTGPFNVGGLVGYQTDAGLGRQPRIDNGYFYNSGNPPVCVGGNNNGIVNCTGVGSLAYFYDPANPPMTVWDFPKIWRQVSGDTPDLRWADIVCNPVPVPVPVAGPWALVFLAAGLLAIVMLAGRRWRGSAVAPRPAR